MWGHGKNMQTSAYNSVTHALMGKTGAVGAHEEPAVALQGWVVVLENFQKKSCLVEAEEGEQNLGQPNQRPEVTQCAVGWLGVWRHGQRGQ